MPYPRPSLQTLIDRISGDIEGGIEASAPLLPNSVLTVFARVFAASCHLLWGFLQWVSRQVMPDTAEAEYLERWAAVYGIYRTPATYAVADLQVTGTSGIIIPEGTTFIAAGGTEYVSQADVTTVSGTATLSVKALTAGSIGTLAVGQVVQLVQPVAGVLGQAVTLSSGQLPGVDSEDDESLRIRLLKRIQDPPQGGSNADYIEWMLASPDVPVLQAWCYGSYAGPGTVGLTFSVQGGPVPSGGQVTAMANYLAPLAPVTAQLIVFAPTLVEVDCTIHLQPDGTSIRAAVQASLEEYFADNGAPGITLFLSQINEAIASVAGVIDHSLTIPAASIVLGSNEIAALGEITWI